MTPPIDTVACAKALMDKSQFPVSTRSIMVDWGYADDTVLVTFKPTQPVDYICYQTTIGTKMQPTIPHEISETLKLIETLIGSKDKLADRVSVGKILGNGYYQINHHAKVSLSVDSDPEILDALFMIVDVMELLDSAVVKNGGTGVNLELHSYTSFPYSTLEFLYVFKMAGSVYTFTTVIKIPDRAAPVYKSVDLSYGSGYQREIDVSNIGKSFVHNFRVLLSIAQKKSENRARIEAMRIGKIEDLLKIL